MWGQASIRATQTGPRYGSLRPDVLRSVGSAKARGDLSREETPTMADLAGTGLGRGHPWKQGGRRRHIGPKLKRRDIFDALRPSHLRATGERIINWLTINGM